MCERSLPCVSAAGCRSSLDAFGGEVRNGFLGLLAGFQLSAAHAIVVASVGLDVAQSKFSSAAELLER